MNGESQPAAAEEKEGMQIKRDAAGNFVSKLIFSQSDAAPHLRGALATAPGAVDQQALAVYPNPAAESFVLTDLAGPGDLTVRNMLGKVVLHQRVNADAVIDIRSLPVGLYLLNVSTPKGQLVRKLVKQ